MNGSEHPRQRIGPLFMVLMGKLRSLPPSELLKTTAIRLIREFGIACYERAYDDVMNRNTLPAPKYSDHEAVTGSYSLVEPREDAL